jgi:2-keto-4-pentenoate hydratase/2-oxohepta-3-ene-1,7-dioic acid hydratase in catechol pathway
MQTRYGRIATGEGQSSYFLVGANGAELLDAPPWLGGKTRGDRVDLESFQLLCPVSPSKIICIGKNYGAHVEEMGGNVPQEPLMFLKPPSSLVGSGGVVRLPRRSTRVDYEAELGVVIGRRVRNVSVRHAMEAVFGYVPLCDVTARDLQREDGQWTRAKGYDTFCPVGPMVHAGVDPAALGISLQQNGTLRQDATTQDMVHNVASLVSFSSSVMTLEPGDLIATGTPAGVGPLADGDHIVIRIAGLTDLEFTVQAE